LVRTFQEEAFDVATEEGEPVADLTGHSFAELADVTIPRMQDMLAVNRRRGDGGGVQAGAAALMR
jgi:hypothetical protein